MSKFILPLLKGNLIILDASEIKYIKSDGPVVYIIDGKDQQMIGSQSLKFFKDLLLEASFYPISQSTIINLQLLRMIDVNNQEVELICGKRLAMSRNGLKDLKAYIRSHNFSW